jgi:hypothetical protein
LASSREEWDAYNAINDTIIPNINALMNPIGFSANIPNVFLNDFPVYIYTDLTTRRIRFIHTKPNSIYCPQGSFIPLTVSLGYYTTGYNATTKDAQLICPVGWYCVDGMRYSCPGGRYGNIQGLFNSDCSGICSKGFYCPSGSTLARQNPCPIGKSLYSVQLFSDLAH